MTTPSNISDPTVEQARSELREGIENSRQMVRRTRTLIELSESDGAYRSDDEDYGLAN